MHGEGGLEFGRNLCMLRKFFDRSVLSSLLEAPFVPSELDESNRMGSG